MAPRKAVKKTPPTPEEVMQAIMTRPTIPLWPHCGFALNLSRPATFAAAREGKIKTLSMGRRRPAITSHLRKILEI
jgi:hypothetical protein